MSEAGLSTCQGCPDGSAYSKLCLTLRNVVIRELLNGVKADRDEIMKVSRRIRNFVDFLPMKKRMCFNSVAGVDAGGHRLPLLSKFFGVVSALVYMLPKGRRFFTEPDVITFPHTVSSEKFKGILSVRREAKLYETAIKFIERFGDRVELVLVDGPLAFSGWLRRVGRKVDRELLFDNVNRFLRLCEERSIPVAGVVKRASARFLIYHLGLREETKLPDSFLLLHCMRAGERTDIFSPMAAVERVTGSSSFMNLLEYPVYSFYARFSRSWLNPPVRIDMPSFSLEFVEEIADYCYATSYTSGIPLAIVRADEEVRVSKQFMAEVYLDAVSKVSRMYGAPSFAAPVWGEGSWMVSP